MTRVYIEHSRPYLEIAAFAISFGLVAAGYFASNNHLQIAAILPGAVAIFSFFSRSRPQEFVLTETGVEDQYGNELFDYNDVLGLAVNNQAPLDGVSQLPGGLFQIHLPHKLLELRNVAAKSTSTLYQLLLARTPESGSRNVCHQLQQRLTNQLSLFDDESVFSFISRKCRSNFLHRYDPVILGVLITSVIWIVIGVNGAREYKDWENAGAVMLFSTIVLRVLISLSAVSTRSHFRKLKNSALVVSPTGIAMHQGKLAGQLKWSEVTAIENSKRRTYGYHGGPYPSRVIIIKIAGAEIPIYDIYDRPLAKIHRSLMTYWSPPLKVKPALVTEDPFEN